MSIDPISSPYSLSLSNSSGTVSNAKNYQSLGSTLSQGSSSSSNIHKHYPHHSDNGSLFSDDDDDRMRMDEQQQHQQHQTTVGQTWIHLVKGYVGPGCLSLPWAISQLGIPLGCLSLAIISGWTSYNCWIVVKLKRYIEQQQPPPTTNLTNTDGGASEAPSSTMTSVTYPEVGDWAYGRRFHNYVIACVCVQQLAVCTVFLSFIGENVLAVLQRFDIAFCATHVGVITLVLPAVMALSFLPNLKALAPVVASATLFLGLAFASIGVVMALEWKHRPTVDPPPLSLSDMALAMCAILYSYEGICLILPVESAMKEPRHFSKAFMGSMTLVALVFAIVSCSCVLAFGTVTNGSVTAFLVNTYRDDPAAMTWLMMANALASVSVLLTYPLQLYPALELLAPMITRCGRCRRWNRTSVPNNDSDDHGISVSIEGNSNNATTGNANNASNNMDGFVPLPLLPEHEVVHEYALPSWPSGEPKGNGSVHDSVPFEGSMEDNPDDDISLRSDEIVTSTNISFSESICLRAGLVLLTYAVAVVVPNVQALISLAGAWAGASIALIIPPFLELAWIRHIEERSNTRSNTNTTSNNNTNARILSRLPSDLHRVPGGNLDDSRAWWLSSPLDPWGPWWKEKLKCYFLVALGGVFCVVGTSASLADIVRLYQG
jgi:amino acid permease